jgi:hypothetical protein
MPKDDAKLSAASVGSRAELTGRLAETIGADPALTQSIRIDVNVHNEPTVTVTRLSDADQIGRVIQCSTWADYTLVKNDELKRLRKGVTLTAEEREAVERACCSLGGVIDRSAECSEWDAEARQTLLSLLERTK